jgi:hypothetical protein
MENLTSVTSTFSVFGNGNDLVAKIDKVGELFKDFKHEESKGTLPNGLPTVTHVFHIDNKAVVIRSYRIDIQYGYSDDTQDSVENFLTFVNDSVEKLTSIADSKFNRVAYTDAQFVRKNEDNMKAFNDCFNISNVFGNNGDELQIRVNNVQDVSGESTNAVLVIQDGAVQKKGSNDRESVIFINNDINSSAFAREPRFTWQSSLKLLSDYIMLAKERTNKFLSRL